MSFIKLVSLLQFSLVEKKRAMERQKNDKVVRFFFLSLSPLFYSLRMGVIRAEQSREPCKL